MSVSNTGAITYDAPVNFYVPQTAPANVPPETAGAFSEVYNALQQIILALINNCGIGPQAPNTWASIAGQPQTILHGNLGRFYVIASEAIKASALISLWNNNGIINARNANATDNTRPVDGMCSTVGGIAVGAAGEMLLGPALIPITGLMTAQRYWLSIVNGLPATTPAVAAGNIEQYLGIALSPTVLFINPGYWVQH